MILKDALMADLKVAMKEKNTLVKSTITLLRAAIKQIEVDKRIEIGDGEIIDIISKQIKQKQNAIEDFKKAERQDLVDEAYAEIDVLMKYMPKQMTQEEIVELVKATIIEVGATGPKDMGKVMGVLKGKTKGIADGKTVSQVVKEQLGQL